MAASAEQKQRQQYRPGSIPVYILVQIYSAFKCS